MITTPSFMHFMLYCDNCNVNYPSKRVWEMDIRDDARTDGWLCEGDDTFIQDLCPECKPKNQPE